MEFLKNDLKFCSHLHFKLSIVILEYSNALKKQKVEEKTKRNIKLEKRRISDQIWELKVQKGKIQLEIQKKLEGTEEEIHELIKAR